MPVVPPSSQVTVDQTYVLPTSTGLADTISRASATQDGSPLVSQTLQMTAINLPTSLLITSISFISGATPINTGVHQIFGLFDDNLGTSSGTPRALLRGTSDDGATAWAANTLKTLTLTSTVTTTRPGLFYIGILIQATTPPSLIGGGGSPAGQVANLIAPIISGRSNAGITALPNPASAMVSAAAAVPYAFLL